MYDEGTRTIGLKPKDLRHANAFPLKHRKSSRDRKYSYRCINAAPFCMHFDIRPEKTMLFNNVDLDDEGTMLLELGQAVRVGRGSR